MMFKKYISLHIILSLIIANNILANNNEKTLLINCTKNNECIAQIDHDIYNVNSGQNGLNKNKIEGDKTTPIGKFKISNTIYYRSDKIKFHKKNRYFKYVQIKKNFGWCDDSNNNMYNQFINLHNKSCKTFENLHRDDHLYDIIIPIEYNANPSIKQRGSAIFIHIKRNHNAKTAGCIAFEQNDLMNLITALSKNNYINIRQN